MIIIVIFAQKYKQVDIWKLHNSMFQILLKHIFDKLSQPNKEEYNEVTDSRQNDVRAPTLEL